jgi:16S rRNA (guanine966-N2)-methyltransferase
MRIVAGRWRGRTITAPDGRQVRPTSDRVREAWMSIVGPLLPEARVLDLCAGSGALGIEAVSRGAASADLVEIAPQSLRAIRQNLELLGAGDEIRVHRQDALRFIAALARGAYDVAFADPPYDLGMAEAIADRWIEAPFAAVLGIEHRRAERLPGDGERRQYGQTAITFYRRD